MIEGAGLCETRESRSYDQPKFSFGRSIIVYVKKLATIAFGTLLVIGGYALAQEPVENISADRHPNLAAAQRFIKESYDKITIAEKDNNDDMRGHAKRAQELLEQAASELKLAAEQANVNGKKPTPK